MPILLNDFSALALTRAVEANFEDFFRNFSCLPSVEVSDTAEMLRFCTGVPDWIVNGVMRSRLTEVDVDARIKETLDYFRSRRLPMMWLVSPSTQPADLGHHLKAHGLTHLATIPGMAADLQILPSSLLLPPAVTIEEVGDNGRLEDWGRVASKLGNPPEVSGLFAALSTTLGYSEQAPLRNFVAYRDGEPVGTSQVYLGAGVAGVYSICVLPEARRQGIGTALTVAPLQAVRTRGYRIGVLIASGMGASVYRRLGFADYGQFALYASGVTAQELTSQG